MKIALLVFLFIFALEDVKMRSIPVDLLIFYLAIFMVKLIIVRDPGDTSIVIGLMPGALCLVMSILSGEKIGLGDAAIVGIMGITIGASDTLWIWWISSIIALGYCLIKSMTHEKYKKGNTENEIVQYTRIEEYAKTEGGTYCRSFGDNTIDINHHTDSDRCRNTAL